MFDFINMLLKRPSIRDRRFRRVSIEAPAELYFTERKYSITGMVIEISQGGALFREATRYIMDRRRALVVLRLAGQEFPGVIVNVRSTGYGILFDAPVSDDTIAEIGVSFHESRDEQLAAV
jgi:hypothetical protein